MTTATIDAPVAGPIRSPHSQRSAYLLMLASSTAFAVMSECSFALKDRCDWRLTAVARAGVVFLLTAWLARYLGVRLLFRWPGTLWMRSIVGSISMLFTFFVLSRLPVSLAITLFNTFPIWVTLLAWPVLKERPSLAFGLALLSGVIGVALIENSSVVGDADELITASGVTRVAIASALVAALCTAIVMLGLHRLRHLHSLAIVVHFSGVATLVCIGYCIVTSIWGVRLDLSTLKDPLTLALLMGVGGFATLGQIAMTKAFSLGRPQRLAVVGLAQVVVALLFDIALWHATFGRDQLVGMVLIVAPVAWLLMKGQRQSRSDSSPSESAQTH